MRWIKLSLRKPSVKIDGSKVLIHRIPAFSHENDTITVIATRMVKHCQPNETWWMPLPEKPNY